MVIGELHDQTFITKIFQTYAELLGLKFLIGQIALDSGVISVGSVFGNFNIELLAFCQAGNGDALTVLQIDRNFGAAGIVSSKSARIGVAGNFAAGLRRGLAYFAESATYCRVRNAFMCSSDSL
jgi:hypothetical protein